MNIMSHFSSVPSHCLICHTMALEVAIQVFTEYIINILSRTWKTVLYNDSGYVLHKVIHEATTA